MAQLTCTNGVQRSALGHLDLEIRRGFTRLRRASLRRKNRPVHLTSLSESGVAGQVPSWETKTEVPDVFSRLLNVALCVAVLLEKNQHGDGTQRHSRVGRPRWTRGLETGLGRGLFSWMFIRGKLEGGSLCSETCT